ncbi:MAG TPA: TetR/AcrR family transcriptional regulator [Kofleriaceae bacterium]|nr:TetR/AcrR family transcriptional regulator [Kofleriaceae bacterium]
MRPGTPIAQTLGRVTKTAAYDRTHDDRALQAAARLFREQGYAGTSIRDIARAAGMLPGSLHYRYATKEDILAALMERAIDRLIESILAATAASTDPLERLRSAIVEHVRILLSREDSVYVLLYDWRSLSPGVERAIARHRKRYEQFADDLIAQAAACARLQPGVDLYLLRQFGFGAANWVAQWFDPKGPYSPEQIADAFFRYLTLGTLRPEGG